MQEIRIEAISVEDLQTMVRTIIRDEVAQIITAEISRFLSTPVEDRLVSRAEAMKLLGIKSRTTILNMEKHGHLDPVKIGARASYRLVDIQELISNRKGHE